MKRTMLLLCRILIFLVLLNVVVSKKSHGGKSKITKDTIATSGEAVTFFVMGTASDSADGVPGQISGKEHKLADNSRITLKKKGPSKFKGAKNHLTVGPTKKQTVPGFGKNASKHRSKSENASSRENISKRIGSIDDIQSAYRHGVNVDEDNSMDKVKMIDDNALTDYFHALNGEQDTQRHVQQTPRLSYEDETNESQQRVGEFRQPNEKSPYREPPGFEVYTDNPEEEQDDFYAAINNGKKPPSASYMKKMRPTKSHFDNEHSANAGRSEGNNRGTGSHERLSYYSNEEEGPQNNADVPGYVEDESKLDAHDSASNIDNENEGKPPQEGNSGRTDNGGDNKGQSDNHNGKPADGNSGELNKNVGHDQQGVVPLLNNEPKKDNEEAAAVIVGDEGRQQHDDKVIDAQEVINKEPGIATQQNNNNIGDGIATMGSPFLSNPFLNPFTLFGFNKRRKQANTEHQEATSDTKPKSESKDLDPSNGFNKPSKQVNTENQEATSDSKSKSDSKDIEPLTSNSKGFNKPSKQANDDHKETPDSKPKSESNVLQPLSSNFKGTRILGGKITGGKIIGGLIQGGNILAGDIEGGVIKGGQIEGGKFLNGSMEGGLFHDGLIEGGRLVNGTFDGGSMKGGSVYGGKIKGGSIEGGDIEGGLLLGGRFQGGSLQGGVMKGGDVEGGSIKGGNMEGGIMTGGSVEGGSLKDGKLSGGTLKAGAMIGGEMTNGSIEGGILKGGSISGGTLKGGTMEGGELKGGVVLAGKINGGIIEGGVIEGGEIGEGVVVKGGHVNGTIVAVNTEKTKQENGIKTSPNVIVKMPKKVEMAGNQKGIAKQGSPQSRTGKITAINQYSPQELEQKEPLKIHDELVVDPSAETKAFHNGKHHVVFDGISFDIPEDGFSGLIRKLNGDPKDLGKLIMSDTSNNYTLTENTNQDTDKEDATSDQHTEHLEQGTELNNGDSQSNASDHTTGDRSANQDETEIKPDDIINRLSPTRPRSVVVDAPKLMHVHVQQTVADSKFKPTYHWSLSRLIGDRIPGSPGAAMITHGHVQLTRGGLSFNGNDAWLNGGDFAGGCISAPDKCDDGFSFEMTLKMDKDSINSNDMNFIVDSGASTFNSKGFSLYSLHGKLRADIAVPNDSLCLEAPVEPDRWQDVLVTWKRDQEPSKPLNDEIPKEQPNKTAPQQSVANEGSSEQKETTMPSDFMQTATPQHDSAMTSQLTAQAQAQQQATTTIPHASQPQGNIVPQMPQGNAPFVGQQSIKPSANGEYEVTFPSAMQMGKLYQFDQYVPAMSPPPSPTYNSYQTPRTYPAAAPMMQRALYSSPASYYNGVTRGQVKSSPVVTRYFSPWSSWSACSKSCGYGVRARKRTCLNPQILLGGKVCSGPSIQHGFCFRTACSGTTRSQERKSLVRQILRNLVKDFTMKEAKHIGSHYAISPGKSVCVAV